jgi:reactive intermediate/imine deaminase
MEVIATKVAPAAIGTYSQAVKVGSTVYLSGQIPLVPETMEIVDGSFKDQVVQVITNLEAVTKAAGGGLEHIVKLMVYLTDLANFSAVNDVMESLWPKPYPARAAVGVAALPRAVAVEMDAIMVFVE